MDNVCTQDELHHHGIKGMKWGIRRYQNKDGTLTPKGQKRYNQEMERLQKEERALANKRATQAKMAKLDAARKRVEDQKAELEGKKKKDDSADSDTPKKKSLSEMTDQEVFAYRQRLQNEKDILNFQQQISSMTPREVTAGEKIVGALKENAPKIAERLWNDVGKDIVKDVFGEDKVDTLTALTKEANIWEQKEKISKAKNTIWNNDKNQKNAKEAEERRVKEAKEAEERRAKETANEKAKKEAAAEKAKEKEAEQQKQKEKDDLYESIIDDNSGPNWSRRNNRGYEYGTESVIIDAEWSEVVSQPRIENGRRYINARLKHSLLNGDILGKSIADLGDNTKNSLIHSDILGKPVEELDELYHYGVLGMKWGVHRYYNKDGTRTAAGKKRENETKREKREKKNDGLTLKDKKKLKDTVYGPKEPAEERLNRIKAQHKVMDDSDRRYKKRIRVIYQSSSRI